MLEAKRPAVRLSVKDALRIQDFTCASQYPWLKINSVLHPNQQKIHPLAGGVTFDRFRLDDVTRQAAAFRANIPPKWRELWEKQKWTQHAVSAPRDNYGWKSA